MGFKGGEASSPAYSTVAWMIHFSKDWLKILEANKKSDRDSQRSVLEMFWFAKKRVMALMNMSAFMKVHVEAIMRNLALTCSQAWVFFPKSWMYSENLNDFPQDVWLDSWNLSHVIWICMNLLVSLFSPNSLNLQARCRRLSVENNFVETLTW